MSTASLKKSSRREILEKLWELGRTMSTQTVFLHQALAQGIGLNATDTKCLDLILQGDPGKVTAGQLADSTGLTTGAVTHILDRLEKRKFIERARDTRDRRKIFIKVRPESIAPLVPRYEAIGKAYMALVEQYTDKDLQLIADYLQKTSEISQQELKRVIAENRDEQEKA
jgi:DNA-binding MarR family transcriptional regulator